MKIVHLPLLLLLCLYSSLLSAYSFGQNKVQATKEEWSKIETMHFDVYFPKGEDEFGKTASLMAEEAYYYLKEGFKYPIKDRIPIIFYISHQGFQTTNVIYSLLSEGVGGFTESIHNRVVVPFDGNYRKLEEVLTHELTHAYINDLDAKSSSRFFNFSSYNFPFWFSEGLPEYMSIGGLDNYNNMFILDMVMNDYLYPLDQVNGYYAYRMGESFLTWIGQTYGRSKVLDYFFAVRTGGSPDNATKKVFGLKFKDLESRWRNGLKRKYSPIITEFQIPDEEYTKWTDHTKSGAYFNYMPRLSPDGQQYVYFNNDNLHFSIRSGELYGEGEGKNKNLLNGELSGKFEEFHFKRSNFAWFPDNDRFAFVSKTSRGDVIYIYSIKAGKTIKEIFFPEMDAIYELDIDRKGERLAFCGQHTGQSDIFLYQLDSGELTALTDDRYDDSEPRFSPDGTKIAFTSERMAGPDPYRKGIFSGMLNQVYILSIADKNVWQVTDDAYPNHTAMWDSTGNIILFLTEKDYITNYDMVNIQTGERAPVTKMLSGVFVGDISQDNSLLIFACYYNNGWDIYSVANPLENRDWQPYHVPEAINIASDFTTRFNLDRYKIFGKRELKFREEMRHPSNPTANVFDFGPVVAADSVAKVYNDHIDAKPDSASTPVSVLPYKVKFSLDSLWGGGAYSSSDGAIGSIQMTMSDVMGNHAFATQLGLSGKLKNSNFVFQYFYLPYRIDYGGGIYYLTDETTYQQEITNGLDNYYRKTEWQSGIYGLISYPFNKFWRADFEQQVFTYHSDWDDWIWDTDYTGHWSSDSGIRKMSDIVYAPSLSLIHDNAIYGPTGPVLGWRSIYTIRKGIAQHDYNYLTNYADLRGYALFAKRYSVAGRIAGGVSEGESPETFDLDWYDGVRGYDRDEEGEKKFLSSVELRVPFIDQLSLGFPFPITFGSIRGSIFTDIGAVWDHNSHFRAAKDGRLKDLRLGFGFGPRINLGYFVIKMDMAWSSDLIKHSSPSYFFSLGEDF